MLAGVHASLDRALEEGWSMVLEGVHLVPGLVEPPPEAEQAVVARCILEIEDPAVHQGLRPRRLVGRRAPGCAVPRPLRRDQADPGRARARATRGDAVIESANVDEAVMRALDLVLAGAEQVEARPVSDRPPCLCESYARVTERAALAGARWLGRADVEGAEEATFSAMRGSLDELPISGRIVIGAPEGRGCCR